MKAIENINLYELKKAFIHSPLVVLAGEQGVGKTYLAEVYQNDDDCKDMQIFKLDARSLFTIRRDFSKKANELRIEAYGICEIVNSVLEWFEKKDFLFIFDNITKFEVKARISSFLPSKDRLKDRQQILLISEQQFALNGAVNLTIRGWTRSEAYLFLANKLPGIPIKLLTESKLAECLNYMPISICLAQSYINNTGIDVGRYIEKVKNIPNKDIKYSVVELSMREAFAQGKAKSIMQLLSYRSGNIFSLAELEESCTKKIKFSPNSSFKESFERLDKYGLVSADEKTISTHEVVREMAKIITGLNALPIFAKGVSRWQRKANLIEKANIFNSLGDERIDAIITMSSDRRGIVELTPCFADFRKLNYNERKLSAFLNKISETYAKNSIKKILTNLCHEGWERVIAGVACIDENNDNQKVCEIAYKHKPRTFEIKGYEDAWKDNIAYATEFSGLGR
jgi:hypothetical protein